MEARAVQPYLVVLESSGHHSPRDALVSHSIAVRLQASRDKLFLFRGDERGLGRPVHHIPVSGRAEDNGENTFDDENPPVAWSAHMDSPTPVAGSSVKYTSILSDPQRLSYVQCPMPGCHQRHPPAKQRRRTEQHGIDALSACTTTKITRSANHSPSKLKHDLP